MMNKFTQFWSLLCFLLLVSCTSSPAKKEKLQIDTQEVTAVYISHLESPDSLLLDQRTQYLLLHELNNSKYIGLTKGVIGFRVGVYFKNGKFRRFITSKTAVKEKPLQGSGFNNEFKASL